MKKVCFLDGRLVVLHVCCNDAASAVVWKNTYLPQDDEFVPAAIPSTHICRCHRWNCFQQIGQVHFMCPMTNVLHYSHDKITSQLNKSHFVFNLISFFH